MHEFPPGLHDAWHLYVNGKMVWLMVITLAMGLLSIRVVRARWSCFAWGAVLVGVFLHWTNHHMGFAARDFQSNIWRHKLLLAQLVIACIAVARCISSAHHEKTRHNVGYLVMGGIAAWCFLWTTFPIPNAARQASTRAQCKNNLKQIGIAMHNYHDAFKAFPMAVAPKPDRSWRVTILPFVYEDALHERYAQQEPWDSVKNTQLQPIRVAAFDCPGRSERFDSENRFLSAYAAVTGQGTIFARHKSTKLNNIIDGSSNTMMVVEACGSQIVWTQPRDVSTANNTVSINGPGPTLGTSSSLGSSYHQGGTQILLADASVRFISQNISPDVLRSLTTSADGDVVPAEW
ncbi:MAG: DUF1559 domain-containing protein [Fuerstiella sp.]